MSLTILLKTFLTKVLSLTIFSFRFFGSYFVNLLSISGVVFNEMKGVYSQPDNILGRITQQASFDSNSFFYQSLSKSEI